MTDPTVPLGDNDVDLYATSAALLERHPDPTHRIERAGLQGAVAYRFGHARDTNPHAHPDLRPSWDAGYTAAIATHESRHRRTSP